MQIDKKTIRNIFLGVLSCIVLYWVLSDAERAAALVKWAWKLIFLPIWTATLSLLAPTR